MTTFDERERAFEGQFAHDEEMTFRAEARRALWLGLWAGRLLGLTDTRLVDYAKSVIRLDFERAGLDHVIDKITSDLRTAAVTPEMPVAEKAAELLADARISIMQNEI